MAEQEPTFNWNGNPSYQEGNKLYYNSFMFCNVRYALGDFVYLLPEDEGAPLYIARLKQAYEDTNAAEGERLSIQVQWFERKDNSPEDMRAGMHDKEVLESDCCDNNLVGCIDRKIQVVKARDYEHALTCMSEAQRGGEWFFCRGRLTSQEGTFVPYTDEELSPRWVEPPPYMQEDPLDPYGDGVRHFPGYMPDYGMRGGFGRAPRGPMGAPHVSTFSLGPGRGIPGKVCAECGATTTPQWREGPAGPKSLCNACGVRYQRATKAKSGAKRPPPERRNSPPVRGPLPKQARSGPGGSGGGRGRGGGGRGPPGYGGRGVGRPWGPPGQPLYSDEEGGLVGDVGEEGDGDGDLGSGDNRGRDASPPGRRGGEPLQRTKTQEAAELLSTFKMGAALAGPPPGSSPGAGRSGLVGVGPGGSDMLPLMSLDERGRQGSPSATGYGGHNGSPAQGMRGPMGPSRFARDIPSPILVAAAAASGDMPPLAPEMPALAPQQVLPPSDPMAPSGLRHLLAAGGAPGGEGGPEADHALADAEHAAHSAHAAHVGASFDGGPRGLTDDDILKLWQRSTQFLGDSPPPAGLVGMMAVLPPHWHTRLADVKARAEVAANSANAAAAAVTAVAAVLEQKQRLKAETAAEAAMAFRQFQEVVTNAAKQFGGFKSGVGRVVRGPVGPDAPSSPGLSGASRLPPPGGEQLQAVGPLSSLLLERDTPPAVGAMIKEEGGAAAAAAAAEGAAEPQAKQEGQEQQLDDVAEQALAAVAAAAAPVASPSGRMANGVALGAVATSDAGEAPGNLPQQQQLAAGSMPEPAAAQVDGAAQGAAGNGEVAPAPSSMQALGVAAATKAADPAGVLLNNTVKCTSPPNGGTDSVDGDVAGAPAAAAGTAHPSLAAEPPAASPA